MERASVEIRAPTKIPRVWIIRRIKDNKLNPPAGAYIYKIWNCDYIFVCRRMTSLGIVFVCRLNNHELLIEGMNSF